MKGVLLVSHGKLAEVMADSASLFYGDAIAQFGYLCLNIGDSPDDFGSRIQEKAKELDSGYCFPAQCSIKSQSFVVEEAEIKEL